jgi:hypothetical protein
VKIDIYRWMAVVNGNVFMLRAIKSLKNILSILSYNYQMYVQTNVYLNHSPWSFRLNKTPPSAQLDPSVKIHQTIHSPSQLELNPVSYKNPAHHSKRRKQKFEGL